MNIVVTGGNGTFARALREWMPERHFGDEHVAYLSRAECDVTDAPRLDATLFHAAPDVVLHAAAITDHATPDARGVIETNIIGTQHVAQWCRSTSVPLVYLSTHYVYPGTVGGYREIDAVAPIGAYAMSKLAGERVVEALCVEHLIVRGSWYDYDTRLKRWLNDGAMTDAWVSRESVRDAARKVAALIRARARGTFNIGGPRRTFMQILVDEGYEGVLPTTRDQMTHLPYPFPADVSVSTAKFDALKLVL